MFYSFLEVLGWFRAIFLSLPTHLKTEPPVARGAATIKEYCNNNHISKLIKVNQILVVHDTYNSIDQIIVINDS